jgi:hypothetical protein
MHAFIEFVLWQSQIYHKSNARRKKNSLKTKVMEAYHKPRIDASPKKGIKFMSS